MNKKLQQKKINKKYILYTLFYFISFSFFFSQCSPGKATGAGGKYKYDRFHSSDFPAYVESITFLSGNKLSSTSVLKWGNWTISFPKSGLPVAKSGGNGEMYMTGFIASNPVEGEYPCTMQFCKACAFGYYPPGTKPVFIRRCRITITEEHAIGSSNFFNTEIVIDCPGDVQLKQ